MTAVLSMACPDRLSRLRASDLRTRLESAEVQYRFGDYVLDPDRRELTRGSEAIAVGPQVFDLLLYLVQNRERVVSKDSCWTCAQRRSDRPKRP